MSQELIRALSEIEEFEKYWKKTWRKRQDENDKERELIALNTWQGVRKALDILKEHGFEVKNGFPVSH